MPEEVLLDNVRRDNQGENTFPSRLSRYNNARALVDHYEATTRTVRFLMPAFRRLLATGLWQQCRAVASL